MPCKVPAEKSFRRQTSIVYLSLAEWSKKNTGAPALESTLRGLVDVVRVPRAAGEAAGDAHDRDRLVQAHVRDRRRLVVRAAAELAHDLSRQPLGRKTHGG